MSLDSLDPTYRFHIKEALMLAQSNTCWYCEHVLDGYPFVPTLDHIIPIALGGTDHPTNLVVACVLCNFFKSDRTDIQKGDLVGAWPQWLIDKKRRREPVRFVPQGWIKTVDGDRVYYANPRRQQNNDSSSPLGGFQHG